MCVIWAGDRLKLSTAFLGCAAFSNPPRCSSALAALHVRRGKGGLAIIMDALGLGSR